MLPQSSRLLPRRAARLYAVGIAAVIKLGNRLARRNHLYLFAWLCALVVPLGMHLLSGQIEEVRTYIAYYYGPISLYMYFTMTYGFGAVFVSYYLTGGLRKPGTLDMLRVSGVRPWELVTGVMLLLQMILVPPLVVFAAGLLTYFVLGEQATMLADGRQALLAGMGGVMLINELILAGIPCLGLFRRAAGWALIAALAVLPLNTLPMLVWLRQLPITAYVLLQLGAVALVYGGSVFLVARMWPPQRMPRSER